MPKLDPKLKRYFKGYNYSSEIIMMSLYFKFRYSLSYRDIEELSKVRGLKLDHSTIQRWVEKFAALLDKEIERARKHDVNASWRMDELISKLMVNGFIYIERLISTVLALIFYLV